MYGTIPAGTGVQALISAAVQGTPGDQLQPHHPIQCFGEMLQLHEDGSLVCPHAKADPGDARTGAALVHSVALMIMEEASRL